MAILREQAQFDTSGVRGFDKGGIDWARQSLTYTLKIYDTSDVKVAEIAGDLENTTLIKLDFKTTRKGGCADFSFELAEPYTTATIAYNYKVEIYLFNHFSPWFTGYIEEVPEAGTDKRQYYAGYGYFEKFNKKLINTNFTAQEISVIAATVLDDDIIANYPAITKNTNKIESTGYTLAGTLQFERQFARDVFNLLADVANDYEFGVDADAEFFFRAIDTTVLERFWVGTHITEFTPEKDYSKIVNRWYVYAPPFSDGSNYQIMVEDTGGGSSQVDYGLAEDWVDAPAIISIYSSTDIANGKTATANPDVSDPGNMVDDDNSTLWESGTNQTIGHWVKINLGATFDSVAKVVLDSIHSTAQEYHATKFKIEVSTNDSDYTEVFACTSDPGWKPTITFNPVAVRYIKITLTAAASVHWKVGEVKVYELDTADLERWAAQVLIDSKDPILRAVATIKGIDKVLLERQIVAPINPRGKCRITDRDGTTTHDYAIISCEYSLSSSGLDLVIELGHAKREVSDWIRTLRSQIAENRLLGIRRGDNIASGTGFGQGSIKSTMIGENVIETPMLRANLITAAKIAADAVIAGKIDAGAVDTDELAAGAATFGKIDVADLANIANLLTVASGRIVIGANALGSGKPGIVINDGTRNRIELGKINSDYAITVRDVDGHVTVDLGSVMGSAKKEYESVADLITTTSTTYVDMTGITITQTLPKCLIFLWGIVFLGTEAFTDGDCRHIFWIDSGTVGVYSGAGTNVNEVTINMWSQALSAGSHTFKIQWKANARGEQAEAWNKQLGLLYWEVQ